MTQMFNQMWPKETNIRYMKQREALDAVAISVLKSNFKSNPKKRFWGFNGIGTRENSSRKYFQ